MPRRLGPRPDPKPKSGKPKNKGGTSPKAEAEAFKNDLIKRMDKCDTAEKLNDQVLMPFVSALEDVCGARGYVMNIYGETANIIFSGDAEHADAIYQIVEAYLDDQAEDS